MPRGKKNIPAPGKIDYSKRKVVAALLNIRAEASMNANILGVLKFEDIVEIEREENGFGKLVNRDGWIALKFTME